MSNIITKHGGDLDAIEKTYGIPKNEIIDFSANINPLGFPESVKKALAENIDIVKVYPDKDYLKLRESISQYTGAKVEHITVGNGSTELISTFINTVNAKNTIIVGPAYSEYEKSASLAGGAYKYFELKEANHFAMDIDSLISEITPDVDLVIMCNPNNPTGTAVNVNDTEKLLKHCKENNAYVMVDETYIEFSSKLDEICSIPLVAKYDNIFVIRGVSKFFAAPGLRLGYGICSNKQFLDKLNTTKDPWSVNILAAFAGERLFTDTEFINSTKKLILTEKEKIYKYLYGISSIKTYPSQSNFILFKILNDKVTSHEIFETLIRNKLLIRDCSSFTFLDETFIRFCIMNPEDNELLLSDLRKILG